MFCFFFLSFSFFFFFFSSMLLLQQVCAMQYLSRDSLQVWRIRFTSTQSGRIEGAGDKFVSLTRVLLVVERFTSLEIALRNTLCTQIHIYIYLSGRFSACTVAFRSGMLGIRSFIWKSGSPCFVAAHSNGRNKSARGKSAITTFPTDYSPLYPLITCKVGDAATK